MDDFSILEGRVDVFPLDSRTIAVDIGALGVSFLAGVSAPTSGNIGN